MASSLDIGGWFERPVSHPLPMLDRELNQGRFVVVMSQ
jgi:hypothetical protein